jgi:ABC-2 type transport system permease protein
VNGFYALMGKEMREILRSWRIWVVPGIALFFAATGPALAKLTPQLLSSMSSSTPGLDFSKLPLPTYVDAYGQWIKNLSQIVTFVLLVSFGGIISSEVSAGTAVLVLTKPVSRAAFVVAKALSAAVLLFGTVFVGTIVTWGFTAFVFGEAPLKGLPEACLAWLVFALFLMSFVLLLSASFDSWAAASGGGVALFFTLAVLTIWTPALRYTPVGLMGVPTEFLAGKTVEWIGPMLITVGLTVALVAAAAVVFSRREL